MLASKLLKPNTKPNKFLQKTDYYIKRVRNSYIKVLVKALRKPLFSIFLFLILIGATALLYPKINQEFTPQEDRGSFFVSVNGPEGATYEYMEEYMTEIEGRMMKYIDNGEFNRLLVRSPRSFGNIESFNSGVIIAIMKPWGERRSAFTVMEEVRNELSVLPGVRIFPAMRQGLGGGTGKPVQFVLGGADYEELAEWRDILFAKINENNPGFNGLDSGYKETRPQIDFDIDYDAAADLGVRVNEIGRTLQTMLSGRNITTYIEKGEEYDVIVEGERNQKQNFNDVENIYVRSQRSGELVPLSNFISVREYGSADSLARYNRVRSITLEANLEEGFALGDALEHLELMVSQHLPDYAITDYKGQSRDFMESGSSILFVFVLGLLVVFLVLAAQFESYVHPFVIMFTVPLAMGGGLLGLWLMGGSINIYSQIGLIMLIGLATKNGILIVEFANQLRDMDYNFNRSTIMASKVRFRPIVMTGLTTIAGSLPLLIASGAGAETRIVIGTVILFGVIAATIFTLFIVPVAYSLLARNTSSPETVAKKLANESTQN
jgi:multidrug efflux pump